MTANHDHCVIYDYDLHCISTLIVSVNVCIKVTFYCVNVDATYISTGNSIRLPQRRKLIAYLRVKFFLMHIGRQLSMKRDFNR